MPLPMVHLAVAVNMVPVGHDSDFLLGNIAPDAIHMRPNAQSQDKLFVHLSDLPGQRYERVRQLFAQYRTGRNDSIGRGFVGGYSTHLLTDFLWQETVIQAFRKQVPSNLTHSAMLKLYYRDADQNDFDLYQRMPWGDDVLAKLSRTIPKDFEPFLTSDEITKWRDRVVRWFDDQAEEPEIEPTYISYQDTLRFIDRASSEIKNILEDWKSFCG